MTLSLRGRDKELFILHLASIIGRGLLGVRAWVHPPGRLSDSARQSQGTHRKGKMCDEAPTGREKGTGPIDITSIPSSASLPHSSPIPIIMVCFILFLAYLDFQDRNFKR